jgi:hypothetical protein
LKFALQKVKRDAFTYMVFPTVITGTASSVRVSTKVENYASKLISYIFVGKEYHWWAHSLRFLLTQFFKPKKYYLELELSLTIICIVQ